MKIGICANVSGGSPLMQRYVWGDPSTRGLVASYREAGCDVNQFSPEHLSSNLDKCIEDHDGFDVTLALVSEDIAARILRCGRKLVGFRHPALERKSTAAAVVGKFWNRDGDPAIPCQVLVPSRDDIAAALVAIESSSRFGEFVILKGNTSSKSREGLFEHLIVARGALKDALHACDWPHSGILVSALLATESGISNTNGTMRKIMAIAREATVDRGAVYTSFAGEHYLIPNQVDLEAVKALGVAPISAVMRCGSPCWLRGNDCDVPSFDRLLEACSVLGPLGSILTLDVMVVNGTTYFLEANHFSATYADCQFTGRAAIDDLLGMALFDKIFAAEQAVLLERLQTRILQSTV